VSSREPVRSGDGPRHDPGVDVSCRPCDDGCAGHDSVVGAAVSHSAQRGQPMSKCSAWGSGRSLGPSVARDGRRPRCRRDAHPLRSRLAWSGRDTGSWLRLIRAAISEWVSPCRGPSSTTRRSRRVGSVRSRDDTTQRLRRGEAPLVDPQHRPLVIRRVVRSGSARGARPVLDQHHREVIVELVGGVFEDGTHQPAQRFGGWQVGQQVPGHQVG
jgi:hypothetical protein